MARNDSITFVLHGLFVAGGVRYIFKISDQLIRRGCRVQIVYPRRMDGRLARMMPSAVRDMWNHARGTRKVTNSWLTTDAEILEVPALEPRYIPDADYVFATAWQTARFVSALPGAKGERFYLLQHYETWSGPLEEVDATWRLPLRKIVVARWLADLARDKFDDPTAEVVNLGVDPETFWVERKTFNERPRVMMMYHHQPWKGCEDGFRAIEIARRAVDFDLVLFSGHAPSGELPPNTEFYFDPPQDRLRELYQSCDVLLSPSWLEGGPMPPMEAMACGCVVVATNSGGIVEYAVDGENALLTEPKAPEALAASLVKALTDRELMSRLSENGIRSMKSFTWGRSADQMLAVLANHSPGGV